MKCLTLTCLLLLNLVSATLGGILTSALESRKSLLEPRIKRAMVVIKNTFKLEHIIKKFNTKK